MKTQIYLWLKPFIRNRTKASVKLYFNLVLDGDYTSLSEYELDDVIESKIKSIMDFADIEINYNFGVISSSLTDSNIEIEFTDSPEERNTKIKIEEIISSKEEIKITNENILIKDDGLLEISLPSINYKEVFDFTKLWSLIEKKIIGSIKEGDKVELKDDYDNTILQIWGGSFLNIGLAHVSVYDKAKHVPNASIFEQHKGLKGGLYVRDDGRLSIGDFERTFYLDINTNNLIKACLKSGQSLNDVAKLKLLDK